MPSSDKPTFCRFCSQGHFVYVLLRLPCKICTLYQAPRPILDGFSQMVSFNYITIFQVGDSSSQFEDTTKGMGRKVKLFHSHVEQFTCLLGLAASRSHVKLSIIPVAVKRKGRPRKTSSDCCGLEKQFSTLSCFF